MNRRRKGVAGIKAKQAKADVLKAEGEKIQNEEFAHMEAQAGFLLVNYKRHMGHMIWLKKAIKWGASF